MLERRRTALLILGLGLFSACGSERSESPSDAPAPIDSSRSALRTAADLADASHFAVYASSSIALMDRAAVHGGDVGVRLATAGPFLVSGYEAALRADARIDADRDLLADRVLLKDRATVGDVQATTLTNQFGFYAQRYPFPTMPSLPDVVPPAPGATPVSVASGQVRALSAGAYATVNVQGRLELSGGTYDLASLTLGNDARLEVLAASQIRVAGRLSTGDRARIEPASGSGLTAKGVRLEVSGQNGTTGTLDASPKAARFGNDTTVRALVLVPSGTLETGHRTKATGALLGRDVLVNLDATVTFEDGFTSACSDCADAGADASPDASPPEPGDAGGVSCAPADCDDENPCTVDTCSTIGCAHAPASNGSPCDDGDACTAADACHDGTCTPGALATCAPVDACHLPGTCDPSSGACTTPPAAVGTACGDGDPCNGLETCDGAGACAPGTPPPVDDGNPCTVDTCDPLLGVVHLPADAGLPCGETADLCEAVPRCDGAGACVAGAPPTCTTDNPCMTATCDPARGCVLLPIDDGTSCDSDMNACNGTSTCQAGQCTEGLPPTCTSTDPCKVASCEPTTGCVLSPAPSGTPGCSPVLEPPALDPTVAVRMVDATAFLYSGSSPVQTGVAPGTIVDERVAVVRGRVLDADGATPKVGATVTILGHPELGHTLTREDGQYDLAVNGGTSYVVDVQATGYLPVQRRAQTSWHGWAVVDDMVLTPMQSSPDLFVTGSPTAQIVRGLVTPAGEDADGARQAVLLFPEDTHITNYAVPDGTPLEVQITEYTRGPQGVQRMPGELPPNVGYTYAVELGLPAATAAGVKDVHFDRDVPFYVDNFTHYPVGETVPLGYYDRDKGAWLAEKSGRILKILTTTGGEATLDVTGDGLADTGTTLTDLGITTSELQALASEYAAGTELWRVTVRHFSAWDANWGFGPPDDAKAPPDETVMNDITDCKSWRKGSIIGCESRTLGEAIPVVGTPFSLRYESDRVPGYVSRYEFQISDASPPQSPYFLGATAKVIIAGRDIGVGTFPAPLAPNQTVTWKWDGRDAYGRDVGTGVFDGYVHVGYVYATVTRSGGGGFGAAGGVWISGDRAARTVTLWTSKRFRVERTSALPLGFGGWSLDAEHIADMEGQVLHYGDGTRRSVGNGLGYTIDTIAGGGTNLYATGPASQANLYDVEGLAHGPDGSLYLSQRGFSSTGGMLRQIGPDGIISTIAGMPPTVPKVDGGPALHAQIWPVAIALGADGSLFFTESWAQNGDKHQVWKLSPGPNPTLHLVAGNGARGQVTCPAPWRCGDGGDARNAELNSPWALAAAADGALFIAEINNNRVRRVGPEGTITTYVEFPSPARLSLRADGVLYVQDWYNYGVGRFAPDGTSTLFPAVIDKWCGPGGWVGVLGTALEDGSLLIPCRSKIVQRTSDGRLVRLAGQQDNYDYGFSGDGGPALDARLRAYLLVPGENRQIFFYDNGERLRRLRLPFAFEGAAASFAIPTQDGGEIHEFDTSGRHLRTSSGLTRAPLFTFGYDPVTHQLASIRDESNNETRIARAPGVVTITAPHGQVTSLRIDEGSGYLLGVTNPAGEVTSFGYSPKGLLTSLTDPRNQFHLFEYDDNGRLLKDVNPLAGSDGTRLSSTFDPTGWTVDHTSPEGRVTRYRTTTVGPFADPAIFEQRTTTVAPGPNQQSTTVERYFNGATRMTAPDGTKISVLSMTADPRWGAMAAFASSVRTDVGFPTTTHSMTRSETRSATLAIANDPSSVTALTIKTTLTGAGVPSAMTERVFTAGSPASWTMRSPAGRQSRATLDSLDRVTSIAVLGTDPVAIHPIEFRYDARGRVDQITQGSRTYTTSYDPATGWVESTSDPADLGVSYAQHDANGRPLAINLPGGRALAMSYDPAGNVVSVTPPNKPAHGFSWDATDRMATYEPPSLDFLPKDTTYTRDKDGLLLGVDPPGIHATILRDDLGRAREIADLVTRSLTYDPQGRLTALASTDGVTLTYGYDGALVTQQAISGPFSHAVNETYDNFFRVTSSDVDGANGVALTYDSDGFVTAAGAMTVTRGNTGLLTSTALGGLTDTFSYSAYGELSGHAVTGSASSYTATYTRDAVGRIDTKTETIGGESHSERYTYDAAGRLRQVFVDGASTPLREWTYDANGNREDGTYDTQDRQLTHAGASFAYGPNGDLTTKIDAITHAGTFFSYDAHGNLRTVTRPAPLAPIEYIIDGQNRRIGKRVGGTLAQGFLYGGTRVIAELDASGAVASRFVYATGSHAPDFMMKGAATYRFVKDHLGSPRLVVDASTGAIAQRLDYDEWGNVTSDTSPGFQPFGFAGGLWDRDTGLVRFGARDYDSTTGRWTSKDESRFGGGLNFYAYANNDPVNFIDPTGHFATATRTGSSVAIEIPIQFVGSANTKANIAAVVGAIEGGWSGRFGKYNVRTRVRVIGEFATRIQCPSGPFNRIALEHLKDSGSYVVGWGLDGIFDLDTGNPSTFAHEAGHLLMLGDTRRGPQDLMETRHDVRGSGARPTEAMIDEVLRRNPSKDYEW